MKLTCSKCGAKVERETKRKYVVCFLCGVKRVRENGLKWWKKKKG